MRGHRIIMDPIMTIFGLKLQLDENKDLEGRCDRKCHILDLDCSLSPVDSCMTSRFCKKEILVAQKRARLLYKGISMKHHQE
jgi:hypothetical protein